MDFTPFFKKLQEKDIFNDNLGGLGMGFNFNGKTKVWASRIAIVVGAATIIGMLYAQTIDKGKMLKDIEHNGDKNTLMELRIEKRDVKFDTFLIQQTKKNTIDSMNTLTLMKFLDAQIELNKEVTKHLIREDN